MTVNDVANMLDGWTRLRVKLYVDERDEYETVFDSDDNPGWVGDIPESYNYRGIGNWEVCQFSLEDNHIVLMCDSAEEV